LSGRGLCDELITRPEEFYRLCCVVVCDLETSRIGAPYIYDISTLRVKRNLVQIRIPYFYFKATINPKVLVFLIRTVLLRTISCLSTNLCDLHSIGFTSILCPAIGTQVFLTAGLKRGRTRPL